MTGNRLALAEGSPTHFLHFDEEAWSKVSRRVSAPVEVRGRRSLAAWEIALSSALFRFAQLGDHREIFKRSHVALDLSMRGKIAQQSAHDLSRTRLGQRLGKTNIVRPCQRANLLSYPFAQLVLQSIVRSIAVVQC